MSAASLNATISQVSASPEEHESYFQLVWRRFRRSPVSIIGALMVLTLITLACFAGFFSPTSLSQPDLKSAFIPPFPHIRTTNCGSRSLLPECFLL